MSNAASNTIAAEARPARGKNEARRLRRSGRVPAVLYGAGKPAAAVSVDPRAISRILHSESGHNTIFELDLAGERAQVMIVDWQYDPADDALLHIDLKRIAMDRRLRVKVPIVLKGEAAGVKQQGGILEQMLREVELECLPQDIPNQLEVDVTELVFGQVIRVSDLPHVGKFSFVSDANKPVAHITSVKEEEVAPTPEAAAEAAAAAPAEPEVIKKGKQETEEAAEGAEAKAAEAPEKPERPEKKEKKEKK